MQFNTIGIQNWLRRSSRTTQVSARTFAAPPNARRRLSAMGFQQYLTRNCPACCGAARNSSQSQPLLSELSENRLILLRVATHFETFCRGLLPGSYGMTR